MHACLCERETITHIHMFLTHIACVCREFLWEDVYSRNQYIFPIKYWTWEWQYFLDFFVFVIVFKMQTKIWCSLNAWFLPDACFGCFFSSRSMFISNVHVVYANKAVCSFMPVGNYNFNYIIRHRHYVNLRWICLRYCLWEGPRAQCCCYGILLLNTLGLTQYLQLHIDKCIPPLNTLGLTQYLLLHIDKCIL